MLEAPLRKALRGPYEGFSKASERRSLRRRCEVLAKEMRGPCEEVAKVLAKEMRGPCEEVAKVLAKRLRRSLRKLQSGSSFTKALRRLQSAALLRRLCEGLTLRKLRLHEYPHLKVRNIRFCEKNTYVCIVIERVGGGSLSCLNLCGWLDRLL